MANGNKEELAENRTDLAEDRTVLANERTFAGWLRTGMAAVGIGLGFNALFSRMEPSWAPKGIATIILVIAITIFVSAERRACAVIHRLKAHQVEGVRVRNLRLITAALVLATVALIASIWFLKITNGGGA